MHPSSCLLMLLMLFYLPNTVTSQQTMPGCLPTSHEVEAQLLRRIADSRHAAMAQQTRAGLTVQVCENMGRLMARITHGRDAGISKQRQMELWREWYASSRRETITLLPKPLRSSCLLTSFISPTINRDTPNCG